MNWDSRKGKSGLIHMLMKKHGVSKRKAEKAVKTVFDSMKRALWRGECVEIPGGKIWVALRPPGRSKKRFRKFRNIQGGEVFRKLVTFPKKEIHFRPDPRLIDPPPKTRRKPRQAKVKAPASQPQPLPPPTPAEEFVSLYRQLAGVDPEIPDIDSMFAHSNQDLQCLLARLRLLAEQGRRYRGPSQLIAAVARIGLAGRGTPR